MRLARAGVKLASNVIAGGGMEAAIRAADIESQPGGTSRSLLPP